MADEAQELIKKLKTGNYEVREEAASKLVEIGGDSVITALTDVLKTKKDITGIPEAIRSLVKIGEPAVPVLIDLLKYEEWFIRDHATLALYQIVEVVDISTAIPALIENLKDGDFDVRRSTVLTLTVFTLEKLGDERVVPALIDALNDEDFRVRGDVAEALRKIIDKTTEKRDYVSAIKIVKDSTQAVMKFHQRKRDRNSLKARKQTLTKLESLAQEIHDKMNPDKKKFPVKHQPVRTVRRQVIHNG